MKLREIHEVVAKIPIHHRRARHNNRLNAAIRAIQRQILLGEADVQIRTGLALSRRVENEIVPKLHILGHTTYCDDISGAIDNLASATSMMTSVVDDLEQAHNVSLKKGRWFKIALIANLMVNALLLIHLVYGHLK